MAVFFLKCIMNTLKKIFRPFENVGNKVSLSIALFWVVVVGLFWILTSLGDTHLFPSPKQVITGFGDLYKQGLVVHVFKSLGLCFTAILLAVSISLLLTYLSSIPFLKPI